MHCLTASGWRTGVDRTGVVTNYNVMPSPKWPPRWMNMCQFLLIEFSVMNISNWAAGIYAVCFVFVFYNFLSIMINSEKSHLQNNLSWIYWQKPLSILELGPEWVIFWAPTVVFKDFQRSTADPRCCILERWRNDKYDWNN